MVFVLCMSMGVIVVTAHTPENLSELGQVSTFFINGKRVTLSPLNLLFLLVTLKP